VLAATVREAIGIAAEAANPTTSDLFTEISRPSTKTSGFSRRTCNFEGDSTQAALISKVS